MQYLRVADADPAPITLTVSEGATVDGSVIVDAASSPDGKGIVVSAQPADPDYVPNGGTALAFVKTMAPDSAKAVSAGAAKGTTSTLDGGRFRLGRVRGPSRLGVTVPGCDSCYLKSAFVNGADAADTPFDFGLAGTYRGVVIVVSQDGGAIEGRVTDEGDEPLTSFAVVAFSTQRDLWYPGSRHSKIDLSRDGSFRIAGLPPGQYLVTALNRADPAASLAGLNDPDLFEQLSERAQRVTLAEAVHEPVPPREHRTVDRRAEAGRTALRKRWRRWMHG